MADKEPLKITINIADTVPLSLYRETEQRFIKRGTIILERDNLLAEKEIECQALRTRITQLEWEFSRHKESN